MYPACRLAVKDKLLKNEVYLKRGYCKGVQGSAQGLLWRISIGESSMSIRLKGEHQFLNMI